MDTFISTSAKLPLQRFLPFLLALTLLVLPLSSSAKSICLSLSLLTIIAIPTYRADLRTLFSANWVRAAFALFCIALIACLWSPANFSDKLFVVEKYSKLLYLPVLVVGFQRASTRQLSLHAFLVAMIITCVLSILKFHGFLQAFNFDPDHVFRNHIMTGFMVAFAAYLSFLFGYRQGGFVRLAYGVLGLMFTYQVLFISGGRTGYVIYLLLMMLLVLQLCSWRQAILGLALVLALFGTAYMASPVMKMRVDAIAQQINGYQHNEKDTDLGLRLQFHDFAYKLFRQHPFIGNGSASFTHHFEIEKPVSSWVWRLWEPHSQYWLVAAEFGLLGVVVLLFFFVSLIQVSWHLNKMRVIAFAMLVPFMIGNLSDSLLFYSGSGYFFLLFMALCLGEIFESSGRLNEN